MGLQSAASILGSTSVAETSSKVSDSPFPTATSRPVSDGQAWTSINCRAGAIITQQIGPGNKCWVGAGTKANSMAWTHAASKRSAPASECAAPDVLKFTDNGLQKAVRIPSTDGALKEMIEFVKANNFTALAAYTPA
ncbi:hypothetical protein C8J57DRAFT_1540204 [Mycena rebaudengoi]|nr:hypothetical protein C8J57DRAFT_1540204 [Mycena rebaudengoi]